MRNNSLISYFSTCFLILLVTPAICQFTPEIFDQEKVYVHVPKNIYVAGERLKYSTHFRTAHNVGDGTSKIIYYMLENSNQEMVLHWWDRFKSNPIAGGIYLPDTLPEGNYSLYTYTNWMRNSPPGFTCKKHIYMANLTDTIPDKSKKIPSHNNEFILQPEGGVLVNGINNRLFFYLPDAWQTNDTFKLWLTNNDNDTLKEVIPGNDGTGTFILKPEENQNYNLRVPGNKSSKLLPLPKAENAGVTMMADLDKNKSLKIKLFNRYYRPKGDLSLEIYSGNKNYYSKTIAFTGDSLEILVHIEDLPHGVLNIILQENNKPLLERMIINFSPNNILNVDVQGENLEKRQKAKLILSINDAKIGDTAILSVSITKKHPKFIRVKEEITTYLNYQSEIMGNLPPRIDNQNLNDYLISVAPEKYKWNILEHARSCTIPPETVNYLLSGRITKDEIDNTIPHRVVLLTRKDSTPNLEYADVAKNGKFYFLLDESDDNKILILMADGINGTPVRLYLDEKTLVTQQDWKAEKTLSEEMISSINEFKDLYMIDHVYTKNQVTKDTSQDPQENQLDDGFLFIPDFTLFPADYYTLKDFYEITNNIVPGVKFKKKRDGILLRLYNQEKQVFWDHPPVVFLNGIPFGDLEYIGTLGSRDIKSIRMSGKTFFYGNLTFKGVLSIVTYDGKIPENYLVRHSQLYHEKISMNNGIHQTKIDENLLTKKNHPLVMSEILWDPYVKLIGNETLEIEFITPDLKGEYVINIQGMVNKDIPASISKSIYIE